MTTAAQRLANINSAIDALIADPQVDYKEGDVEVKAGQKMQQLLKARQELLKNPEADLTMMTFDYNVGILGADKTEIT